MHPQITTRFAGALSALLLTLITPLASGQTASQFDDERLVDWSARWVAGDHAGAYEAIEADLLSESPHPFASWAWVYAHRLQGNLAEAIDQASPALIERIGEGARAALLRQHNRSGKVIAGVTIERVAAETDALLLYQWFWAAHDADAPDLEVALLARFAELFPDTGIALDMAMSTSQRSNRTRELLRARFLDSETDPPTRVGEAIRAILAWSYGIEDLEESRHLIDVASARQWLTESPLDISATQNLAIALRNQYRFDESLEQFDRVAERFPFYSFTMAQHPAAILINRDRIDEARNLISRREGVSGAMLELRLADAAVLAGHNMLARRILGELIEEHPGWAEPLLELARLEHASGRYPEAAELAEQALEQSPANVAVIEQLAKSLRDGGKPERCLAVIEAHAPAELLDHAGGYGQNIYFQASLALESLGRDAERRDLMLRATRAYPDSAFLNDQLADAVWSLGQEDEAITLAQRSLDIDSGRTYSASLLQNWLIEHKGITEARRVFTELAETWPGERYLTRTLASLQPNDELVLEVLADAARRHPDRWWAAWDYAVKLEELGRWADSLAVRTVFSSSRPGDAEYCANDTLHTARLMQEKGVPLPAPLNTYLHAQQKLNDSDFDLRLVYEVRRLVLTRLGLIDLAVEEAMEFNAIAPDSLGSLTFARNALGSESPARWEGLAWHRYADRDHFDGDRLREVIHTFSKWHGSPIEAVRYGRILRKNLPAEYTGRAESEVLAVSSRFGDARELFVAKYGPTAGNISTSERYVRWYESERTKAMSSDAAEVTFDFESGEVISRRPGSITVRQGFDPITGKVTLQQVGAAWIRLIYDDSPTARLVRLETSSGEWVAITYNNEGLISAMDTGSGDRLRFEYSEARKPRRIEIPERGWLDITHDEEGEIESIEATSVSGESTPELATTITSAFQELLLLIRAVDQQPGALLSRFEPPDDRLDELIEQARSSSTDEDYVKSLLDLVDHRLASLRQYARYGSAALSEVDEALGLILAGYVSDKALAARGLTLWHTLHTELFPDGLDDQRMRDFSRHVAWMESRIAESGDSPLSPVLASYRSDPLSPAEAARWLPGSDLDSDGYWRHWNLADALPESRISGARTTAALITSDGELIVGTTRGLCVRREGWWEWYGFNDELGRLQRDARFAPSAVSEILSLAETEDRSLWIGTANGLLRLAPSAAGTPRDFTSTPERFVTENDGLPNARVEHLASEGGMLLVGTEFGLVALSPEPRLLTNERVRFLNASPRREQAGFLFGTDAGVWSLGTSSDSEPVLVHAEPADSARWGPGGSKLLVQSGNEVVAGFPGEGSTLDAASVLADNAALRAAGNVHGISIVRAELNSGDSIHSPGILTDAGLLVHHNGYFERIRPRHPESLGDVIALDTQQDPETGRSMWLVVSSNAIHLFEQSRVRHFTGPWIRDLLSLDQWGLTFVATGESLDAISHETGEYVRFRDFSSTQLAAGPDGTLYTNHGPYIMRFATGNENAQLLFNATSSAAPKWGSGGVRDLCVASDGTLWVASGASVFRYTEGADEPEEFCYFTDPERFPSRSIFVDAVFEKLDGTIRVTTSDEGHNHDDNGAQLIGGPLEFDGEKFVRVDEDTWNASPDALFWRTYTPIDDITAIATSNTEFHVIRDGWVTDPYTGKNPSYQSLYDTDSRLWMGTRGVRFPGEDLWLFGCARGVVGYKNGVWLGLNRLNSLLPRDDLRKYGSRHAYAIETDPRGRVYVGTSQGLLIYETGGDATSLLYAEGSADVAAFSLEQDKLRAQSDILVRGMLERDPDNPNAELIRRLRERQRRIEELQTRNNGLRLEQARTILTESGDVQAEDAPAPDLARLRQDLARQFRRLERDDPSLAAMLQLKPLELSSLQDELPDGITVVQVLPARDSLFINTVSNRRFGSKEVEVTREELFDVATRVARLLRIESRQLRGLELAPTALGNATPEARKTQLDKDLAWLYDKILLPIERNLADANAVVFSPVGPLAYVPPAAFIRAQDGRSEFAVERYTFTSVPDLYLLVHSLKDRASLEQETLVVGDPDGSLPGARAEAERVHQLAGSELDLLLGKDATVDRMRELAAYAGIVHLATHGRLNSSDPVESGLLFADRELKIYEVDSLDLEEVDLAVLSACESGLGPNGLEYATLARAFVGAGAKRTIATLWQVNDTWAERLMREFYEFLMDGTPPHEALARAQRRLIKRHGEDLHPAAWSGYTLFGAPEQ